MPTQKLTTRSLAVKPPASGTLELWDKVVPGLALRVSYGGTRSWSVMTRVNGRQIRRKIGTVYTHSLAEARDAARDVIRDAAKGIDPRSNVEQARQESDRAAADTFRAVAEAWLRDDGKYGARNLKSRALIESRLERLVHPKIGALPIASIAKQDVRRLVEKLAQEYPIGANRTLADIRCVFRWAVAKDKIAHSPVVGLESPADEKSRERVLENAEIAKLWPAFDTLGYPFGPAFKLLLLTGARRSEVAAMTWNEIDLDENLWRLPGERTKNGKPHLVPLSAASREIIDDLPHIGPYVFTTNGRRPITGFARPKERLDRDSGVTAWRTHDLRRSLVTGMSEMGIDPHVVEAVVNHASSRSGVAGTYNRATYLPQRTAALEAWAQHVMDLVSGKKAKGNVIDMRKAK